MSDATSPRRQRAAKACLSCRSRKLRCDVSISGVPCAKCKENATQCETIPRKKRVAKRTTTAKSATPPEATTTTPEITNLTAGSEIDAALTTSISSSVSCAPTEKLSFSGIEALHSIPHYPFLESIAASDQALSGKSTLHDTLLNFGRASNHDAVTTNSNCGEHEMRYLESIGAFELPNDEISKALIKSYFDVFHPFFPIIDKPKFLKEDKHSLLLQHAIYMIGCASVPTEVIIKAGFNYRKDARNHFYLKARRLYEMDHEQDSIIIIQSLLLISQYYPSVVEKKHTWHWIHQAISLSQLIGLNRDPGDTPDRALWARIWWACVVRDRCNGMGTGRPLMINSLDCTVPLLEAADLAEDGDDREISAVKTMFIEFTRLCQCVEGVLTLQYSTPSTETMQSFIVCERSLYTWRGLLPYEARWQYNDNQLSDIQTLYRCILHAAFNTLRITLLQSHVLWNIDEKNALRYRLDTEKAALENTQIFSQLGHLGLTKWCPTIAVTFTLSPLVVHVLNIKTSTSHDLKTTAFRRFDTCMMFLSDLGNIYWHALFYSEFFRIALKLAEESAKFSVTEGTLSSFLNQRPLSLGHLLVLQKYQQEMKAQQTSPVQGDVEMRSPPRSSNDGHSASWQPSASQRTDTDLYLEQPAFHGSVVPFA